MTTKAPEKKLPPAPKWDLDSIFPGGSKSDEFKKFREQVKADLKKAEQLTSALKTGLTSDTKNNWIEFIGVFESVCEDIELVISFANALASADVSDSTASNIVSEGYLYLSRWEKLKTEFESAAMKQSDSAWNDLMADDKIKPIEFFLNELRDIAQNKMPVEMEKLASELAVNGYHGWDHLYGKLAGDLKVTWKDDSGEKEISLGQNATKFSSSNRADREQAFKNMTTAWESVEDQAAMMLNFMAGFRLSLYERRGWESPQFEPLKMARMQKQTLDTMWKVIRDNTARLKPYIEAKKKLLGFDKFMWYDQFAPVGNVEKLFAFDEAGDFVVNNITPFSKDMGQFCRMALDKNWIEAEDRPGKRGGGFCTGMGKFKQTRIFMTYAGTYENLLTLAHELGHAYHGWVLKDRPYFAQGYPMNLAETASTFAEAVVTDAALDQVDDPQEKLMLLEQKIQATYTFFCDIQSRYLFDSMFYEKRKDGMLSSGELRELMIDAQKKAFAGLLDDSGYHPLFWCSKLHFYITDAPFYNFPYTFGFLFSGGIYARAKQEGAGFADKYQAFLADTGSMTTEDVAKKHLGVDITGEKFWQDAVEVALADVDEFVKLANELA